ncbi:TPA: replication protein [Staphylococcus aureus]|uniref:replication protein n=1 Tax=Staphylococcus borealis TaxID=2742203 RepID=UPI00330FD972|nr:replication protein [Staphylococcus aureus]HDK8982221.1 replication protein [Staphylococcus aureus]
MNKDKARYFTFLLYPESIPDDWELKLELTGVSMAISPLHDRDKSNVEGQEYKKPHYHVIYVAANPVTTHSVRKRIQRALGNKSVAKVQFVKQSMENIYLYLTHESKDAIRKNKYVYDKAEIKHINNFDIDRYITIDVETKNQTLKILLQIIRAYSIPNVLDLHDFIEKNGEGYGIDMNLFLTTIESKSSILRLYFDGAYQRSKRSIVQENRKD